jgi:hypothetical protein
VELIKGFNIGHGNLIEMWYQSCGTILCYQSSVCGPLLVVLLASVNQ